MKFSLNSPIRRTIIANLFGVSVNLLNQIVLVPFYLVCWGTSLYADWIVISAFTVFFSMSDIGLNNVIQNQFSMKYAENNLSECNKLLSVNITIVSIIFTLSLIGCLFYTYSFDIVDQMELHVLNRREASFVFTMLMIQIFTGMYSGIESAIFKATRHTDKAVYFDQFARLIHVGIIFVCLLTKVHITIMVVLICIPNIVLIYLKHRNGRKYFRYNFKFSDIDFSLVKQLIIPSVGFLSFPLGNAIILQGYTLLVNKFFGVESVVLFNTTRTMCNFAKTLLSTVQQSVWPEYSIAYGKKDLARMRLLHRKTLKTAIWGITVIAIGLLILGPYIYTIWTHGQVEFDYKLMIAFLVILFFDNLWISSSVTLMATNNHMYLGLCFVLSAGASLAIAYSIAYYYISLSLVVYSMLFMHLLMTVYTINKGLKLTKDRL
ncbi:hypothetical protein [Phocaeicola barnesiae]|uniref:hypothetical protein n=1 Tax=Phocaeicola barnesiae TaxID=376804 RepID=UPI00241BF7BA|nr:hypothetical protein [Phocaeicola barnesiae]